MSKNETSANSNLTETDLADIEGRVKAVRVLLSRSANAWLDIASLFKEAKSQLSQHAFERFINDSGFTKSVADKLIIVGKCNALYRESVRELVGFIDGWATLYEVAKLKSDQMDRLWDELRRDPSLRLSRTLVQNIADGNDPNDKRVVFIKVEAQKSKLVALTETQVIDFKKKLQEMKQLFSGVAKTFVVKESAEAVNLLRVSKEVKPNNDLVIVKTAA